MTLRIENVSLESLHQDPANARIHGQRNIDTIRASLKEFGQTRPLVVQESSGRIVAGNGTFEAMRQLGWTHCDIVRLPFSDIQATAYGITDNRTAELAEWDMGVLDNLVSELRDTDIPLDDLGFEISDMESISQDSESAEPRAASVLDSIAEDDPSSLPADAVTRRGDIYLLGNHRLMCGDSSSSDVDHLMSGKKADLLLTDPPYGVSYADKDRFFNDLEGKGNRRTKPIINDHNDVSEMQSLWTSVLVNAHAATTDRASYYLFCAQGGELLHAMMQSLVSSRWQLKHMLVWVKNQLVFGRCDYHYKHEPALYGWKHNSAHDFYGAPSCVSTLEFDRPRKSELHPTMKPVKLCAHLIENSTTTGGIVLDLFGGSGTTLIAAEQINRSCFTMEMDASYCDVIVQRWEQLTGKKATLERNITAD